MHTFTFRPRLESLEDRTTPATIGQIQAAAAETQHLAAQIRTFSHDFQWMANPRFRSFVENYAKNVWFDGTVEIKTFNEAISSLHSQIAARPALAGVLGPQLAYYAGLQAQARGNMAFAQNIAAWLGFTVVPAPAPTIPAVKPTNVTSPTANGTYSVGASIQITVTFSKSVTVTGSPQIALNTGGTANFASGSGTSTLTFNYVVGAADGAVGDLDYSTVNALTLNGGTIVDTVTHQNANLKLPALGGTGSLGVNKNIVIAASTVVSNVTSPTADGTYSAGTAIPITVTFNKAVTVTGTPQLALNSGGTASFASGSGSTTLTFNYTVGATDVSVADLDYASVNALTLNGGTIVDQVNSQAATLALPTPGAVGSLGANKNIVINATEPTVSSPTANGTYVVGDTIGVTVKYNAPVVVTGTPQIALNSGGTASFASGSGTNTLTFSYVVGATDLSVADLDYASVNALTLNGGTIVDQATSQAANLTLQTPGAAGSLGASKNIAINTASAVVSNVTSTTANGTYPVGAAISITVAFDKAVTVTGAPQIALNSGGTASFSSGSGSATLTFNYTVGASDAFVPDLDYASVNALTLNGGTIVDQATSQAANLTLPAPGASGSLGANKAIVIATDAGMTNTMPDVNDPAWVTGANGLKTWDVVVGTGTPVAAGGSITVFYTGWLASNGTQFDARRSPSAPITFSLSGLIQGWQQGIPGMQPGGIRRLFIPAALGYGAAGSPPNIPPNADLVFELKLIATT